jgi:hypothetical protein
LNSGLVQNVPLALRKTIRLRDKSADGAYCDSPKYNLG